MLIASTVVTIRAVFALEIAQAEHSGFCDRPLCARMSTWTTVASADFSVRAGSARSGSRGKVASSEDLQVASTESGFSALFVARQVGRIEAGRTYHKTKIPVPCIRAFSDGQRAAKGTKSLRSRRSAGVA